MKSLRFFLFAVEIRVHEKRFCRLKSFRELYKISTLSLRSESHRCSKKDKVSDSCPLSFTLRVCPSDWPAYLSRVSKKLFAVPFIEFWRVLGNGNVHFSIFERRREDGF